MTKQVYLILGGGGQIGKALLRCLSEKTTEHRIFAFDHTRIDITNEEQVFKIIDFIKPSVIINCAGVSDPELCEIANDGSLAVNVHGLDILSRISSEIGAQIVQFSTWAVFDNNGKREKTEKSATKPKSFYGKSKLKAEHICCKNNKNSLIIRPGWVFGFDTTGLINDWIYNAQRRLKVKVRSGMIGSPTYAEDLAEATYELIDKKATGIYNISNTKSSSYGFLARTTMKLCNLNPDLVIEIGEQCFKAKLPYNSVLSCLKYNNTIGQEIRSWEDALKEGLFKTKRFFP